MKYRKLTKPELTALATTLGSLGPPRHNDGLVKGYRDFVKEYYPPGAAAVVVSYSSEYDDEGYDNNVAFVTVTDAGGVELAPLPSKSKAAKRAALRLPVLCRDRTEDSVADQDDVIHVAPPKIPDLYVLEE